MSARWMSRNVARRRPAPLVSASASSTAARGRAPRRAARRSARAPRRCRRARAQALIARPRTPIVSGWPRPEERRRHRQVVVDAGERDRLLERPGPLGAVSSGVGSPVGDAGGGARRACRASAPRSSPARCGRRRARGGARPAAGRTGSRTRRATCPGEKRRNMSSRSIGLHTDVSKKTPGRPAKALDSAAEVGDARRGR